MNDLLLHPARFARLRCEGAASPIGLTEPAPRLSWEWRGGDFASVRFQIAAATAPERLAEPDLWLSPERTLTHPFFDYAGRDPGPGGAVWWRVVARDPAGKCLARSRAARFEFGLRTAAEWGDARFLLGPAWSEWVSSASTQQQPSPRFRRRFTAAELVVRARLHVCALGLYEASLNGERVGDVVLEPAFTHYNLRALCRSYDVTPLVRPGENMLAFRLGHGWYANHACDNKQFQRAPWIGEPCLRCVLILRDATGRETRIESDDAWQTALSATVMDSIRNGEWCDARRETPGWDRPGVPEEPGWQTPREGADPAAQWFASTMPPIRDFPPTKPVAVRKLPSGAWRYDFGRHLAGVVEVRTRGKRGAVIAWDSRDRCEDFDPRHRAGQEHTPDNVYLLSGRYQSDSYTLRGDPAGEVWRPRFTYHAFRFADLTVTGKGRSRPRLLAVERHTDLEETGAFRCNNDLLNRLHAAAGRSLLTNCHGYITDCPGREKAGWSGDALLGAPGALMRFDIAALYAKWIDDFAETQRADGRIATIAPTCGWGYQDVFCGPGWCNVFLAVPEAVWRFTGDDRLLRRHYPAMQALYRHFRAMRAAGLFQHTLGDWLRPRCTVFAAPDSELFNTAELFQSARWLERFARHLDRPEEAAEYRAEQAALAAEFAQKFRGADHLGCGECTQSELAIALGSGIIELERRAAYLQSLLDRIHADRGHLDTGMVGTYYLLRVLGEAGCTEELYRLLIRRGWPGFAWFLKHGATTLWERWNGTASLNHSTYSYVQEILLRFFAGIEFSEAPEAAGGRKLRFQPPLTCSLRAAAGRCRTTFGPTSIRWERRGRRAVVEGALPAGTTAELRLPPGRVETLNGGRAANGITLLNGENRQCIELAPGRFRAELRLT